MRGVLGRLVARCRCGGRPVPRPAGFRAGNGDSSADHRRRDRHDLHEHQLLPGTDPGGAGHHQRRPVTPGRHPAARRHQIRRPDRDDRRGTGQPSRIRAGQADVVASTLTCWNGVPGRSAVELHRGSCAKFGVRDHNFYRSPPASPVTPRQTPPHHRKPAHRSPPAPSHRGQAPAGAPRASTSRTVTAGGRAPRNLDR